MGSGGWSPGEIFKYTPSLFPEKPLLQHTIKLVSSLVFFLWYEHILECKYSRIHPHHCYLAKGMQLLYKLLSYLLRGHTPIPSAVLVTCSYTQDNYNLNLGIMHVRWHLQSGFAFCMVEFHSHFMK